MLKNLWKSELLRYKSEIKHSKEDLTSLKKESKILSFSQQSIIGKRKLLAEYIEKIDVSLVKMNISIKYKKEETQIL